MSGTPPQLHSIRPLALGPSTALRTCFSKGATLDAMIDIGDELPPTTVDLDSEYVAAFARSLGMGFGRFTDDGAARAEGLPGQICPGNMSLALLSQALLRWAPGVRIQRLGATFRGLA